MTELIKMTKNWLELDQNFHNDKPSLASSVASLLYKKKTSGTEVRRTLDVKLWFVGFIRCVGFNLVMFNC